jgi:hypothetical protein
MGAIVIRTRYDEGADQPKLRRVNYESHRSCIRLFGVSILFKYSLHEDIMIMQHVIIKMKTVDKRKKEM